jgi:hypothetical protein
MMINCYASLNAQQPDSLLTRDAIIAELDSLLSSDDSLSIFRLIDSIMQMPGSDGDVSQLAMRMGYNSNVIAAARTIGFNQFGLAPGVSYYHRSGAYADVTGYWSPEYSPDYYLTVASAGYMKTVGKHWSFLAEYSHYFYSDHGEDVYIPYTDNLGMTNFLEFGPINFRFDYYFYFGQKTAHRLMPGLSLNLEKRNWKGIKRIIFFPSFNVLFGSETVTTYEKQVKAYTSRPLEILYRRNHNLPLFYTYYNEINTKAFGVMNYSLSAPISVAIKGWTFLASYTYNFPKPLPGEDLGLMNSGYFSFSVTRYIPFKKK